jgi:serine/threonine protein kinase
MSWSSSKLYGDPRIGSLPSGVHGQRQPLVRATPPQLEKVGLGKAGVELKAELLHDIPQTDGDPTMLNVITIEEEDEGVWKDELLEYNGMLTDTRTPHSYWAYQDSYQLPSGVFCHVFDGKGKPLSQYNWTPKMPDNERLELIMGLLDGVNFLHSRGSAHLGLDSESIRIASVPAEDPAAGVHDELRIIGLGAAVRLTSGRSTYQMSNKVSFEAPELLNSMSWSLIVETNLKTLYKFDSWAVGILLMMMTGGMSTSPFEANPDWTKGILSVEKATRARIDERLGDMGTLLIDLNRNSSGFLFRHGWMIKIILELLRIDPFERLYVHEAWEIASKATKKLKLRGAATASKKLRVQQQQAAFKAQGLNYTALQLNSTGSTGRFNQEFGRFRQLGNATEGEPFRSLEAMLTIAYRSGANLTIENGTQKYGTRVKNYGLCG